MIFKNNRSNRVSQDDDGVVHLDLSDESTIRDCDLMCVNAETHDAIPTDLGRRRS